MYKDIINSIKSKKSTIGVIGLGYVGLPLCLRLVEQKFNVIGFDIDQSKIDSLLKTRSYIDHIPSAKIKSIITNGFSPTTDFSNISKIDIIVICVPTPLGKHNEPNLNYIFNTIQEIGPYLKNNQLIILESTTYPGTTEEEVLPLIEASGNKKQFKAGKNIFIGYSPEREDPGNKKFSTKTIPKVVSGYSEKCLEITKAFYDEIVDETVPVSSLKVAEMTKIMENIHRAVNIGLVNELKLVCDKMEIDIFEVIKAASTKPFGFTPYFPGPGLGGHCIPIDPFYLTWKAKELGMNTRFIELAGEINYKVTDYVVEKTFDCLNKQNKSINGSRILVLGLSYKKNVDDTRESPSLRIIDLLMKNGAKVSYSDPHVDKCPQTRKFSFDLKSIEVNQQSLKRFDLVILSTDHDLFDYELILKYSKSIIDTRGKFEISNKVIRA